MFSWCFTFKRRKHKNIAYVEKMQIFLKFKTEFVASKTCFQHILVR